MKTYVAKNATIVGDVELAENVSVWYGAVLRGDHGKITIGEGTNIQDNAVLHDETMVGKYCVIGHGAIVHGCSVGDNCLIGMGSIIMDNAQIGDGSVIGAGALVLAGMDIPPHSVVVGNPAKIIKEASEEQMAANMTNALHYIELAKETFA